MTSTKWQQESRESQQSNLKKQNKTKQNNPVDSTSRSTNVFLEVALSTFLEEALRAIFYSFGRRAYNHSLFWRKSWKLNNTLVNNLWVKEEIRQYFKLNENENENTM